MFENVNRWRIKFAVDPRFISGTTAALHFLLLTHVPTAICLCKIFHTGHIRRYLSNLNPNIQQTGRGWAARTAKRREKAEQNGTPTSRFAQERTDSSKARTKEILCINRWRNKTYDRQAVYLRFISETRSALGSCLIAGASTPIYEGKSFSGKTCPIMLRHALHEKNLERQKGVGPLVCS